MSDSPVVLKERRFPNHAKFFEVSLCGVGVCILREVSGGYVRNYRRNAKIYKTPEHAVKAEMRDKIKDRRVALESAVKDLQILEEWLRVPK